jgi:hypothetical protein
MQLRAGVGAARTPRLENNWADAAIFAGINALAIEWRRGIYPTSERLGLYNAQRAAMGYNPPQTMDFLKTIGGKIVGGMVALAVIAAAISWYEMDVSTRHALVTGTGRIVAWFGIVILLPWVTFFVVGWIARLEHNLAGAGLVAAYTVVEAIVLAWLFSWKIHGATAIVFFGAAVLLAAAYNLFASDWIAEKV